MLWKSTSLNVIDVAHHLDAILIEASSLQSLCFRLSIDELLDLGSCALSVLPSHLFFLFFVAVKAVFPKYFYGHSKHLFYCILHYFHRTAVLV